MLGGIDLGIGCHGSIDGQLPLGKEVLKMVEHTNVEWVLHVHTFNTGQVARHLSCGLSIAHSAVIEESPGVSVGRVRVIKPCKKGEEFESYHLQKHELVARSGMPKEVWGQDYLIALASSLTL